MEYLGFTKKSENMTISVSDVKNQKIIGLYVRILLTEIFH